MCQELDPAGVVETRTAVGLPLRDRRVADTAECGTFDPDARVEVPLSRPLGDRVVVTSAYGDYPTPVLPCDVSPSRMHWSPCEETPSPPGQATAVARVGTPYGEEFGPEPSAD